MNRFKKYDMSDVSFEEIDNIVEEYLMQINNNYLKKVEVNISNNDLNINIEPYYCISNKWEELIKILKQRNICFWFRDDDCGIDNESLEKLLDYFEEKEISLFIAAIPQKTDVMIADKILQYKKVYVGQHGYSHTNHSIKEKSEYPSDRNKELVNEEFIQGNMKLTNLFKDKYLKVFIPPWFELDKSYMSILSELDYIALSNYWNNKKNEFNLVEANCQVDFVDWDKAYTFGGEDFVLEQIIKELNNNKESKYIGLLLHHERIDNTTYLFLDKLLDMINKYSKIVDIKEVINSIGEAND